MATTDEGSRVEMKMRYSVVGDATYGCPAPIPCFSMSASGQYQYSRAKLLVQKGSKVLVKSTRILSVRSVRSGGLSSQEFRVAMKMVY
jgi:hypothetical protein